MTLLLFIHAFILGVVEGLTEFLPVSSTGHLILSAHLLNTDIPSIKVFEIFIQLGAILAIVYEYKFLFIKKLCTIKTKSSKLFFLNLFIAFLPAAIFGLIFHNQIKLFLFNPFVVSIALILGGFLILIIENNVRTSTINSIDNLTIKKALGIGLFQCLALIPGTSRSGATIMGGILLKLDRKTATEFSFFLAVPIMFAASFYDLIKNFNSLNADDLLFFSVGFVTSFFTALLIIRFFIKFIANNDFKIFAYYRIIIGVVFLIIFY